VKIIIRTIARTNALRVLVAEAEFSGGDWINAAEDALNRAMGYEGSERRFLVVDSYLGGGYMPPFGLHTVQFATYDEQQRVYRYDEVLRLEVIRDAQPE
jgi:hypothetical protein